MSSEFWMVVCKKPVPTEEAAKFSPRHMARLLKAIPRPRWEKATPRNPGDYSYLGTTDLPDNEFSPSLWVDDSTDAVAFKTQEEAEAAAFNLCGKFPHYIGVLELFSYGG